MKFAIASLTYCKLQWSIALLFVGYSALSEETEKIQIPNSCVYSKIGADLESRVFAPCEVQLEKCIVNRRAQIETSHEDALDFCWNRPLKSDPKFLGPCPDYMAELESPTYDDAEWLLNRLFMRYKFRSYSGEPSYKKGDQTYRMRESKEIINGILAQDPENFEVLILHQLYTWFESTEVEKFEFVLNRFEREPDCPWTLMRVPDSTFRYLNSITENWLSAKGEVVDLTAAELKQLIIRVRELVLQSYNKHMTQGSNEDYLYWAAASLEDSVLGAKDYENIKKAYSTLGIEFENYKEERREMIINFMKSEYGVTSDQGRTHSLRMICNGYAFRIGLVEYCADLLSYYGKKDVISLNHPAADWSHAALLLIDALSWDCTEHVDLSIYYPSWGYETLCFPEPYQSHVVMVEALLNKFVSVGDHPETELLLAYLAMDETSDEFFFKALARNDIAVLFAARLAKRLLKHGQLETANNIVSSIDAEKKEQLERREQLLLEWTTKSVVEDRTYSNWHEQLIGMF